jgi:tetratricopeptide (TPR) repeat protein
MVGIVSLAIALAGCRSDGSGKNGKFLERGKEYAEKKDYARAVLQFRNEAKLLPNSPEPYYQLGLAYLEMKDARAAYAHFKKAVELDPNHTASQIKLAEMTVTSQSKDMRTEAEERAKGVLKRSPQDPDALTVLAIAEIASGNTVGGERQLNAALQNAPKHLKSAVMLASLKVQNGDLSGAEAALKTLVEQDQKSAEAAIALGHFYSIAGKRDEAVRELERAVRLQPSNGAGLLSLVQLQLAIGKADDAEQNLRRLSALPGPEYRTMHARYLYETNRKDAAIAELHNLVQQYPTDRRARALLVAAYQSTGRRQDAEKVLALALKDNPKDTEALLQRGALLLNEGNYTGARNDITLVLQFTPDSAEAHRLMASLHRAQQSHLQAIQELAEAVRLDPTFLVARLDLAEEHLNLGRAPIALELVDKAPPSQLQSLPLITKRSKILLALRRYPEAQANIAQGLKLGRTRDLLMADAQLKLDRKDIAGARARSEEVLKAFPEDVAALENAAYCYFAEKRPDAALQRIRDQVALRPGSAPLQYFLALQLLANKQNTEARSALRAALQADKEFLPAALDLAKLDITDGKKEEARRTLKQLLSSKISEVPARLLLGHMDIHASNRAGAIEQYRRVLDMDPHNTIALNNLSALLTDEQNGADEALKYAQQLKEIAPDSTTADDTLGWALYRKGIYTSALQYLQGASAKSSNPVIKYHLAMAYFRVGDTVRAQRTFTDAFKQSPTLPEATEAKQLIVQH